MWLIFQYDSRGNSSASPIIETRETAAFLSKLEAGNTVKQPAYLRKFATQVARNLTDTVMDIFSSLNVTQSASNETRIKNTAVENYPHHINSVIANRLNKISAPQDTPPATRKVSYASVLSSPLQLSPMRTMENEPVRVKKTINSG